MEVVLKTDLKGVKLFSRGKVRDTYDLKDRLLMIATDRISAFDVVLPNGIPYKGAVLTQLSLFWFNYTKDIIPNHVITADVSKFPEEVKKFSDMLKGRSMLVKKAKPLPAEFVVRGYLSGSGWKDYMQTGKVCGIELPKGMRESEQLPEPIFTPATKAVTGHDLNITQEELAKLVGKDIADRLRDASITIYKKASEKARKRGIIIADTKFEFGMLSDKLIITDEMLTPDSSRFWSASSYSPGGPQKSFDKQPVRDYLESIGWNKQPPAPVLPPEVVEGTTKRYIDAYEIMTGKKFEVV
ncbi:MAG: phosphoribosylaminoimidazolesuccinocarboxamide synthase [Candidatus Micrarchaeota archaeon]|nr:phosphoribosylaminoimidazolesuccinocarboxamide synthase [Candidatus Micrarchaeota archaeon]